MDTLFSTTDDSTEDYYSILECTELSSREQIDTEYKLRAKECHPDKIMDPEQKSKAETVFMKLNKAHSVLGDPETKEIYDKWRRSGLSVTFDQFVEIQSRCRHSVHWVTTKRQPSLTSPYHNTRSNSNSKPTNPLGHFREGDQTGNSNLLSKFRTYKL